MSVTSVSVLLHATLQLAVFARPRPSRLELANVYKCGPVSSTMSRTQSRDSGKNALFQTHFDHILYANGWVVASALVPKHNGI